MSLVSLFPLASSHALFIPALFHQLTRLESAVGTPQVPHSVYPLSTKKSSGIDVVLGGQWGDEGKGKLVDMLSQVCSFSS